MPKDKSQNAQNKVRASWIGDFKDACIGIVVNRKATAFFLFCTVLALSGSGIAYVMNEEALSFGLGLGAAGSALGAFIFWSETEGYEDIVEDHDELDCSD